MNKTRCVICGSSETPLFKFPKDPERLKSWLTVIGKEEFLSKDNYYVYVHNNGRICGNHFSDWCFSSTEKKSLIRFAKPCTVLPILSCESSTYMNSAGIPIPEACVKSTMLSTPEAHVNSTELSVPNTTQSCTNKSGSSIIKSPEARQIATLRTNVSRLKRRLEKATTRRVTLLESLQEQLTVAQYNFILSQIRASVRHPTGRRWGNEEIAFALNIYLQSPGAYSLLRKKLAFPCKRTLQRSVQNIAKDAGFCPVLLKFLQQQTVNMDDKEKFCTLAFDEISIKSGITYCVKRNAVIGFEHYGDLEVPTKEPQLANNALVFMVRGICKNWKQPIAFFFTSISIPVLKLKNIIFRAVSLLHECGLKVISIVCDQCPGNQGLFQELQVTNEKPYFFVENTKVFATYDAPHLLESVRNNFKKRQIRFSDGKSASWEDLVKFYVMDAKQKYPIAPQLTDKHITASGREKMRVKLAAEVFSHSVASGLCVYGSFGHLPSTAANTAEFLSNMDELFDSVNSKTLRSSKKYASALTSTSNHIQLWEEKIRFIESWQFVTSENKILTPPCKEGWILTLNAYIQIWNELQNSVQYLFMNRFNQDCLENAFSSIHRRGGSHDNPNCAEFQSAIRRLMIHDLMNINSSTNCEDWYCEDS